MLQTPHRPEPDVYVKHNSFVDVRHRAAPQEVWDRVAHLRQTLASTALPEYGQRVVAAACDELLDQQPPPEGFAAFTLQSYAIEEINRLTDEQLPRYLFYRYRYEVYPERKILDTFPPSLQVEPSSTCNYRCVFCYQTDKGFSTKGSGYMGHMSLELFKHVIDEAEGQCEALDLSSRGEPLINPQIAEMLAYMAGKFLASKINTNAWFLDEKKCHALLQASFSTIVFSADAADEPTYGQLRVNGKLSHVLENVRLFRDIREKHYPRSRTITRVSGVKVKGTPEIQRMERLWGEVVDQVAFVKYKPWATLYGQPVNDIMEPCSDLWRRMLVWWDGTVNPCDTDYKSTLAVGNVADGSLAALWRSETYMKLRNEHLQQRRSACRTCNRCVVV